MMIKQPFFLVGAERSGTTLLRLILDHHPRVACYYEFEFSVDFIGDDGSFPDLDDMRSYLSRPVFRQSFPNGPPQGPTSFPELMDDVLVEKRDRGHKELIGATVHRHFDRLLRIWPDARFIHIVRDGRDVARSRISMGWDGNVWTAIDEWVEVENLWDELRGRLDPERLVEVRYERLILDPEAEMNRICAFLGVVYSGEMLKYSESSTYSAPDPGLIYQWRRKAASRDIQLIEHKALPTLVKRGYDASGLPPIEVDATESRRLERESRWGKRRFRIRRYGFVLVVLDFISRNLPFKIPRRWVEERVSAVRLRHLK